MTHMTKKVLTIPVHYMKGNAVKLEEIAVGDWIDIPVQDNIWFVEGLSTLHIKLGFSMVLPEGYEAHILPRSSTYPKYGLILGNSMGMIDNAYKGIGDEWMANFFATRDIPANTITKGTRLLQFRIVKTMKAELDVDEIHFIEDDEAFKGNEDRGGFGSTGK